MNGIKAFKAFINGILEFRLSITTSYDDPLINYYDLGREIMHRITFRKLENK
jgi:hypothetical protein